jgi:hypothetical protein
MVRASFEARIGVMWMEALRSAYEQLAAGEPEPLVSLMADDMVWRGTTNPWRFWQPVPS